MFKQLFIATLAAGSLVASVETSSAQVVTAGQVSCRAEGVTDTSMDARYRVTRTGRRTFDASFEAARNAGVTATRLAVSIANPPAAAVRVGTMVLTRDAATGDIIGDLEFDSNPAEGNPFPAGFPTIIAGRSKVIVGPLACTLRR